MMVLAERTRGGLELELIPNQALMELREREVAITSQPSIFALIASGLFREVHNLEDGTDDGIVKTTMRTTMRFLDHPTSTKGEGIGVSLFRRSAKFALH